MIYTFNGNEVPVYHVAGCGGIAFYFLHFPDEGMPLDADRVVYSDGTSPPTDYETRAKCGNCHEDLAVTDLTARCPSDWNPESPTL